MSRDDAIDVFQRLKLEQEYGTPRYIPRAQLVHALALAVQSHFSQVGPSAKCLFLDHSSFFLELHPLELRLRVGDQGVFSESLKNGSLLGLVALASFS